MAHKYVLDTHALVWYLEGSPRLSINAKAVIDAPDNQLVLPLIGLTEAVFIIGRGRTSIPDVSTLLNRVLADQLVAS
jgi:PIN domain nuclease of toxin-antitoxin system